MFIILKHSHGCRGALAQEAENLGYLRYNVRHQEY